MIDKHSSTWSAVKKFVESELEDINKELDSPATSHEMTQYNRGKKAELMRLLRLAENKTASQLAASSPGGVYHARGEIE